MNPQRPNAHVLMKIRRRAGATLRALCILGPMMCVTSCEDNPTRGLDHGSLQLIRMESTLSDLQADPRRDVLYIADRLENVIHVLDMRTDEVIAAIPVGSKPVQMELDPPADNLFVALEGADAVAVVDLETRAVVRLVSVPFEPVFVEVSGDGRIFTGPRSLSDGATLSIDYVSGEVLHDFRVGVGSKPVGGIACVGDSVVVIARGEDLHKWNIRSRDAAVFEREIELDQYHFDDLHLEVSPDGRYVYAGGTGGKTSYVEVYRTLDLVKVGELDTSQAVVYTCLSPSGDRAYVAAAMDPMAQSMGAATQLFAFDTTTFARRDQFLVLGKMIMSSLAVSSDESKLYAIVENPYLIHDNPNRDARRDIQVIGLR